MRKIELDGASMTLMGNTFSPGTSSLTNQSLDTYHHVADPQWTSLHFPHPQLSQIPVHFLPQHKNNYPPHHPLPTPHFIHQTSLILFATETQSYIVLTKG